jgi:nucleotide-binding universal stress UspA family protein
MRCLLAADGSPSSIRAAEWISRHLSGNGKDEVFLVFVFPIPPATDLYAGIVSFPEDPSDERVTKVAQEVFDGTRPALEGFQGTIHEILLAGNPAKEIIEFAGTQRVDLIVTGTRGHESSTELCLGSTSNAVVHRALCPVLIVR